MKIYLSDNRNSNWIEFKIGKGYYCIWEETAKMYYYSVSSEDVTLL